jgi:hypothetical protein
VFVFGNRAFIGSANASYSSADTMLEAVAAVTDQQSVKAARTYVRSLCQHELGPEEIARLEKLYRPPRFTGPVKKNNKKGRKIRPHLPPLRIVQLVPKPIPEGSEPAQEKGEMVAKTKLKRPKTHVLDDFHWHGKCHVHVGDTLIQVVDEGNGRKLISPPANVIHKKVWKRNRKQVTFVYLEVPNRRRKAFTRLAKQLGYGAKKQLTRNAIIRNQIFAEKLRTAWER